MKRCLSTAICLTALAVTSTQAQETGREAFDAWIKSDSDLGITATYDTASESGDTLTIRGLQYTFSRTFQFDDEENTEDGSAGENNSVSVDISFTVPELVADELTSNDAGFAVRRMTLSDGTRFTARITSDDDNEGLAVDGKMDGYLLTNASWAKLPVIEEDPNRPIGRWLPLLNTFFDLALEEQRISRIELTLDEIDKPDDEAFFGYEMRDIVAKNLRNGVIEEYSTGTFAQTMSGLESEGDLENMTLRFASARVENYNIGAGLQFLQGGGSADSDFETYVGSLTLLGYRVESDVFNMNIDRIAYENLELRPPQTNLVELADTAIVTEEFDEEQLAAILFDVYRSFAIGRTSVDGLSVDFQDPDDPEMSGTMKLAQLLLSDLSPDGLGEFSMSSLEVDIEPEGRVNFAKFAIEDIEFAPYGPMKAFIDTQLASQSEPDPLQVARIFTPLSISVSLEDFFASIPDEGEASLGGFLLAMRSTVPPVPTEIVLSIDDLEIPVDALDDREAEEIFKAAGISTLRLSESIEVRWDEATEDLVIDNLVVEVGDVGVVRAQARLGGLPKSVLENPQAAQAAIVTLNLKSLELELVNEGGVQTALGLAAAEAGVEPSQMSSLLLAQLKGVLATIGNEAFTEEVTRAAEAFFADPRNLSLEINPENPVPVMQLIGSAQMAPQTLPDLLGVTVEANR